MSRDAYADMLIAWELMGLELRAHWYTWWFEAAEAMIRLR